MSAIDPDEARRRLLEELSRPEYARGDGLLQRLYSRILELIADLVAGPGAGSGIGLAAAVALAVVLAIAGLLVLRRMGRIRTSGRSSDPHGDLLADPDVPARVLRDRAVEALDAGDHDLASILAMRALVKDLVDRTLLDASAGLTAHEAADSAARSFGELGPSLRRMAAAFDTAAYSRRRVPAARAREAVQLADFIAQTRPDAAAEDSERTESAQ